MTKHSLQRNPDFKLLCHFSSFFFQYHKPASLFSLPTSPSGFLCTDGVKTQCQRVENCLVQLSKIACSPSSALQHCCLSCFSIFLAHLSLLTLLHDSALIKGLLLHLFPPNNIRTLQHLSGGTNLSFSRRVSALHRENRRVLWEILHYRFQYT